MADRQAPRGQTPKVISIEDAGDARVDEYRDLTDAGSARRHGLFIAEGREIVARLLASSRFRTRSVLLTGAALAALADRLAGADPSVPIYVAPPAVVQAIAGFRFHLGCVALGERGAAGAPGALIAPPGPRLLVALERLTNPDNVGGIFRSAWALGADGVLLSRGCADPLYRKAIRVSTGGALVVPFAVPADWPAALAALRAAGYALLALTPDARALDIAELGAARPLPGRVALVVGAEDRGLAPETRAKADIEVRIAMAAGADSLNAATAAAIALHRLRRP
jgi:tRNA G18 (ribose-2'-O)-methylase SpoU